MMNNQLDVEAIRTKLIIALDPDNEEYTMDDFNEEFSGQTNPNGMPDFMKIQLPFSNDSDNEDPEYGSDGASGFDFRAALSEPITLEFGERALIPTGLKFEIPTGFEIQVRPRSGLALKKGVTVLNTPGTIDSDYRGYVSIILINFDKTPFTINNGDRIAQGVMAHVTAKQVVNLNRVEKISENTDRGSGGFGSTGTK